MILRRCANEVRRVVGAAGAFVLRDLRIGAQRPRHWREPATAGVARRDDLGGRGAAFPPPFERAEEVRLIRPHAAATVAHAGNQEYPHPVVLLAAERLFATSE